MKKNTRIILCMFTFMMFMFIGCGNVNNSTKTDDNKAHTIKIENHENTKNNINIKKEENIKNNVDIEKEESIEKNINCKNKSQPKENVKKQIVETEKKQKEYVIKDNKIKEEKYNDEEITNQKQSEEEKSKSDKEEKKDIEIASKEETEKENNNEVEKSDKEKFTLTIAKNSKGYTGKDKEILAEKELEIKENTNAMTYLRDNFDMKEKGGFIYEIMEIHNKYPIPSSEKTEEQKKNKVLGIDWYIYINGKKAPVGANDVYPVDGDKLLFDFHEWDKREFLQPEE